MKYSPVSFPCIFVIVFLLVVLFVFTLVAMFIPWFSTNWEASYDNGPNPYAYPPTGQIPPAYTYSLLSYRSVGYDTNGMNSTS